MTRPEDGAAARGCPALGELERFLREELIGAREQRVREHIDACAPCRARLEAACGESASWGELREVLAGRDELAEAPLHGASEDALASITRSERRRDLARLQDVLADAPDDASLLGRIGSDYDVLELVGRGSTGLVVKAFDRRLARHVAIKILDPAYARYGPARVRFEREGRAAASISDEHVVPIYAVDEAQGQPFLVMQFVDGESLQERIRRCAQLPAREVVRLGLQIAKGLAAAHAQGIIHRDVKPANVMLVDGTDKAMVTDFGLARVADESSMTSSGSIAGTPEFMSPEQAKGEAIDARSDLFSLGSVLYAACTGRAPFRSETVFGVIKRVCDEQPRDIREIQPEIDAWLVELIAKLHAKDASDRFASANELAEALEDELRHMQAPLAFPEPARLWRQRRDGAQGEHARTAGERARIFGLAAGVLLAFAGALIAVEFLVQASAERGASRLAALFERPALAAASAELPPQEPLGAPGELRAVKRDFEGSSVDGFGIYLPLSYERERAREYPLHVWLPGGCAVGGRVDSLSCNSGYARMLVRTVERVRERARRHPERQASALERYVTDSFVVVIPHMRGGSYEERQFFEQEGAIRAILREVSARCRVDISRVYLGGAGRGGHGVWGLASRMPEYFAAASPARGNRAGIASYAKLASIPLWVAHNREDSEVAFEESRLAVEAIEALGGAPFVRLQRDAPEDERFLAAQRILTSRPDACSTVELYRQDAYYRWLLQHRNRLLD